MPRARGSSLLLLLFTLAGTAGARAQTAVTDASPRIRLNLDAGWRYQPGRVVDGAAQPPDSAAWQRIDLPHTWNARDALDREVAYRRGVGWYERRLELPPALRGKRLYLYFEGANQVADVWVNGRQAGHHAGGYTAFAMEITALVREAEPNLVRVRVDNSPDPDIPPLNADFTFYGGIYRDVWLIATEPLHLEVLDHASPGIVIDAPGLTARRAVVRVRWELRNDGAAPVRARVVGRVLDPAGRTAGEATSVVEVPAGGTVTAQATTPAFANPRLWSPEEPNLYTVRTEVYELGTGARASGGSGGAARGVPPAGAERSSGAGPGRLVDRMDSPLGLRFYAYDGRTGFSLNGKPRQLHGVNKHQDFFGLGNAVPNELQRRDLRLIKENGFDFVRLAHYPQDPAVLDEADRLGIILWEEIPVVNRITLSPGFAANAGNMVTEMVRQHRNHPSVFFWGYMNEIMLRPPRPAPAGYADSVVALARRLNARVKQEDPTRPTVMAIFAQDPVPALHRVPDILGLNLYFGWYYGVPADFGTYVDSMHAADPTRPLMISEYGANGDQRVHAAAPVPFDYSVEYQRQYHEAIFPQILARPWLLGSALWNMFDFGAYPRDDARPNINDKGLYTFDRRPKDVASYYRARLRIEPFVQIASRDQPERAGSRPEDRRQPVVVYSNQAAVELLLDGISLGSRPVDNGRARWTVQMHDGANRLEARAVVVPASGAAGSGGEVPVPAGAAGSGGAGPVPAGAAAPGSAVDAMVVHYEDRSPLFTTSPGTARRIALSAGSATQYVDAAGLVWEADRAYAPGGWGYVGGTAANTHHRVFDAVDDPLLQTTREGASAYRFDVPDGRYDVELRFLETMHDGPGERVFGVVIDGVPLEPALDLAASAGRWHARSLQVRVDATGGQGVRIELPATSGTSTISAIRVSREP